MDIWIIRNGEKIGPIHDYEARRRLQAGELASGTHAWHEGLDAWRPLCEMAIFKDDMNWVQLGDLDAGPTDDEEDAALLAAAGASPPPPTTSPVLGRRFWARWLDIHIYIAAWWLCMWITERNIDAVFSNLWIMAGQLVPWFIAESILIHRFATTPGKWLFGLRVVNTNGTHLSLRSATLRSFRILGGGIGLGWSLLALFCQTLSYFTAKRLGNALWDHAGGHRVESQPLAAWRILAAACIFFAALQLQMAVVPPSVFKNAAEALPDSYLKDFVKENLEKNPPWHLPPR
ncbi:MAG: RDD family protein [Verrucomicrobia bacterium]|nr:MAG: RDD family protein [Verrucomicrobiota bacterium]